MWTIALLLCSVVPQPDGVYRGQCDILERNNFYDENGGYIFTQLIAWNEYPDGKMHVWFWKMAKEGTQSVRLYELQHGAEIWFDEQGTWAQIKSLSFYESWEQFDPEVADRVHVPPEKRLRLCPTK